jgi:hypothetical protein
VTPAARQILNRLEAAEDMGCTDVELAFVGGRWWRNRIPELRKLGYDIHEQSERWFLEGVPGVEGARGDATPVREGVPNAPAVTRVSGCGGSSGTLSTGLDVGRDSSQPGACPGADIINPLRAAVSPSTETLFDPPAPGHYESDVAA